MRNKPIAKWDRVTGYILLAFGVITAWSSTHLPMGKLRHPGPGFLPFGLALVLILLSLALIFTHRKRDASPTPFWPERTWLRPLLGALIFMLYAFFLGHLGFLLTTFIFLLVWMGLIERMHWGMTLSLAGGVTFALYLIFGYFLDVPLPWGFLER
jgi:putative tricarboxylic transport membrane protein